jgi:hypothetical protein
VQDKGSNGVHWLPKSCDNFVKICPNAKFSMAQKEFWILDDLVVVGYY